MWSGVRFKSSVHIWSYVIINVCLCINPCKQLDDMLYIIYWFSRTRLSWQQAEQGSPDAFPNKKLYSLLHVLVSYQLVLPVNIIYGNVWWTTYIIYLCVYIYSSSFISYSCFFLYCCFIKLKITQILVIRQEYNMSF